MTKTSPVQEMINNIWWAHKLPWISLTLSVIYLSFGFFLVGSLDPALKLTIIFSLTFNAFLFLALMATNFTILFHTGSITKPLSEAILGEKSLPIELDTKVPTKKNVEKPTLKKLKKK
jgi:hypothetical protein